MQRLTRKQSIIAFTILILVAVTIRLLIVSSAVKFGADQGMDSLVLWHMQYNGHRPLVGPPLTAQNVFTPPTYYYVSWIWYHIRGSFNDVAYGYAVYNIVTLIIFLFLAVKMFGRPMAILAGILFSFSTLMVAHATSMWQPYPIQMFLVTSLLSLWLSFEKRSSYYLWASYVLYAYAVSVYPSPLLLFPYMLWQGIRWHNTVQKKGLLQSTAYSLFMIILSAIPAYGPQILFSIHNNFPTLEHLRAIPSASFSLWDRIGVFKDNIALASADFWGISTFTIPRVTLLYSAVPWGFASVYILTVWRTYIKNYDSSTPIQQFLHPAPLFLGLLSILYLHPYDAHGHRLWAFYPFFLLYFTYIVSSSTRAGIHTKIIVSSLVASYMLINITGLYLMYFPKSNGYTNDAQKISEIISHDMRNLSLTKEHTSIIYHVNNTPWSYALLRILYWLVQWRDYDVDLTVAGNDIDVEYFPQQPHQYVYLICEYFGTTKDAKRRCANRFLDNYPTYISRTTTRVGNAIIFLFSRDCVPMDGIVCATDTGTDPSDISRR